MLDINIIKSVYLMGTNTKILPAAQIIFCSGTAHPTTPLYMYIMYPRLTED